MISDNPVVHFEMPYRDRDRIERFYQRAFGWKTQPLGPEMGDYVLALAGASDAKGRPTEPGRINGGFFPRREEMPGQHPSVVIAVESIEAAMNAVRSAGGKVFGKPMDIPGVGRFVAFEDSEGNRLSLLQAESQRSG